MVARIAGSARAAFWRMGMERRTAMSRYGVIMDRIRAGDCILIDGATGTEAQRRGVPQLDNAWNGGGALSHPDIIRQVHLDYLESGAEMIISNSFATHLLNNGADINSVKELLGHASLAATQIYTHTSMEKIKSIYKKSHPRN